MQFLRQVEMLIGIFTKRGDATQVMPEVEVMVTWWCVASNRHGESLMSKVHHTISRSYHHPAQSEAVCRKASFSAGNKSPNPTSNMWRVDQRVEIDLVITAVTHRDLQEAKESNSEASNIEAGGMSRQNVLPLKSKLTGEVWPGDIKVSISWILGWQLWRWVKIKIMKPRPHNQALLLNVIMPWHVPWHVCYFQVLPGPGDKLQNLESQGPDLKSCIQNSNLPIPNDGIQNWGYSSCGIRLKSWTMSQQLVLLLRNHPQLEELSCFQLQICTIFHPVFEYQFESPATRSPCRFHSAPDYWPLGAEDKDNWAVCEGFVFGWPCTVGN